MFSGRNGIEVECERRVPVVEQRVAVERELDPFDLVKSVRSRTQSNIYTGRHGLPVQRVCVGDKHPAVMGAGGGAQACGGRVPGCAGNRRRRTASAAQQEEQEEKDDDDNRDPTTDR